MLFPAPERTVPYRGHERLPTHELRSAPADILPLWLPGRIPRHGPCRAALELTRNTRGFQLAPSRDSYEGRKRRCDSRTPSPSRLWICSSRPVTALRVSAAC